MKEFMKFYDGTKGFVTNNCNNAIIWTDVDDKTLGYGYLSCTISNQSQISSAIPSSKNDTTTKDILITWPELNYINIYLKDTMDNGLLDISRDVIMKLDKKDNRPKIVISFYTNNDNVSNSINDGNNSTVILQKCSEYIKTFIKNNIVVCPTRELRVSRSKDEIIRSIKPLLDKYKAYCHISLASEKDNEIDEHESLELLVTIPRTWIRNKTPPSPQKTQKSPAKGPTSVKIDKDYIASRIHQYVGNTFRITNDNYQLDISEGNPPVIRMSFVNKNFKDIVLTTVVPNNATYVKFKELIINENIIGIRTAKVTLVYSPRNGDCEPLIIDEIEEDIRTVDLFPKSPSNNRYRSTEEDFFFSTQIIDYVKSECERIANFVSFRIENQEYKKLIVLEGSKIAVNLVHEYLQSLVKSMLKKNIKIPEGKQWQELVDAIKYKLKIIRAQNKKKRSQLRAESDTASEDDVSLMSGGDGEVSRDTFLNQYKTWNATLLKKVILVSFPQNREDWQSQCDACNELISNFVKVSVSLEGTVIKGKQTIRTFMLQGCVYNPDEDSVMLSGLQDRVEAAISFIEQKKRGEQPVTVTINCTKFNNCVELAKYLQLPHCREILNKLRDDILNSCTESCTDGKKAISVVIVNEDMIGTDDSTDILSLTGPDRVLNGSTGIVAIAENMLMVLVKDMKIDFLPLNDWEVEWLASNNSEQRCDALVEYITSSNNTNGPNGALRNEQIKYSCRFGTLELKVIACELTDTGTVYGCNTLVNSANNDLRHIGGIANVISELDGPKLTLDCNNIITLQGSVKTGEAVVHDAHDLSAYGFGAIIHAVPPSNIRDMRLMRQCVHNILNIARDRSGSIVAIPGLGMGIFDMPIQQTCEEIICAISEWSQLHQDDDDQGNTNMSIVLFDKNEDVINGFVNALNDLKNGNFDTNNDQSKSVISPQQQLAIPQSLWYWQVWDHEVSAHKDSVTQIYVNGKWIENVMCYDYDQQIDIENAYRNGSTTTNITGDKNGLKNANSYIISFQDMTQTIVPRRNDLSRRPVYRVKFNGDPSIIPLYNTRKSEDDTRRNIEKVNEKKVELLLPTHIHDYQLSPSAVVAGVKIFGTASNVDVTKQVLLQQLVIHTRSKLSTPAEEISQSDNAQSTQEEVDNRPSENASGNNENPVEKVSIVMERRYSLETPEKQVSI
jgi:O-acetyl-ADP-ribose deacetylase (regulator of RNase III)